MTTTRGHCERMDDQYDLARFVTEQNLNGMYDRAEKELRAGRKESHWMWFVFPQLDGLAQNPSALAKRFAITSADEAVAYLAHDVLGPRLRHCAKLVAQSGATTVRSLIGSDVDVLKLRSSMTLFAAVAEDGQDFVAVLQKYFPAGRDQKTMTLLRATQQTSARHETGSAPPKRRRSWFGGRDSG